MESTDEAKLLVSEINRADYPELLVWLRGALAGRESRLPLDRDETPALGLTRLWPYLNADARNFLGKAALSCLRDWLNPGSSPEVPPWLDEEVDELFGLVRDIRPPSVWTLLWTVINEPTRFERLTRSQQIDIQNFLEEWSEPAPSEAWLQLVKRDPVRFGATVFGALARNDFRAACAVLAELPGDATPERSNELLHSFEFRAGWVASVWPVEGRADSLRILAGALQNAPVWIRQVFRQAMQRQGCPLPDAGSTVRKPIPKLALHTLLDVFTPSPCDALSRLVAA